MQRDKWVFKLPASQLVTAAQAKVDFHTERLAFWQDASKKTMVEIREKGISVETSLAGDNYNAGSNVTSRGFGPQIVVDETFQRRLNEADGKIKEHIGKLKEYTGWLQVLKANDGRSYQLHSDDYLYFFGK